jgi:hypothetical protein
MAGATRKQSNERSKVLDDKFDELAKGPAVTVTRRAVTREIWQTGPSQPIPSAPPARAYSLTPNSDRRFCSLDEYAPDANQKTTNQNERKVMNDKFDELAKGMAQSVTRRGALKKFGLGLAGIALAALGLADEAQAGACKRAGQHCHRDSDCCSGYCYLDTTGPGRPRHGWCI